MKLKMKEYLEFLKSKEREFVFLVNEQHLPLKSKIEVLGLLSGLFRGLRTLDTTEKLEKIIKDIGSLSDILKDYSDDKIDNLIEIFLKDFLLFSKETEINIYRDYITQNKEVLYAGLHEESLRNILLEIVENIILKFLTEAMVYGDTS